MLNFYYQIIKEDNCFETKVLALAGLKMHKKKFTNWKQLKTDDERFNSFIDYVEEFQVEIVYKNPLPVDTFTFIFTINFIEHNIDIFQEPQSLNWAIDVLKNISILHTDNSFLSDLYCSITNIIILFNGTTMKDLLKDEEILQRFLNLLDMIPPEIFNKVTMKLLILGDDFKSSAQKILSNGKGYQKDRESNVMSYLLWDSNGILT